MRFQRLRRQLGRNVAALVRGYAAWFCGDAFPSLLACTATSCLPSPGAEPAVCLLFDLAVTCVAVRFFILRGGSCSPPFPSFYPTVRLVCFVALIPCLERLSPFSPLRCAVVRCGYMPAACE